MPQKLILFPESSVYKYALIFLSLISPSLRYRFSSPVFPINGENINTTSVLYGDGTFARTFQPFSDTDKLFIYP